jgi:hypothetical protein
MVVSLFSWVEIGPRRLPPRGGCVCRLRVFDSTIDRVPLSFLLFENQRLEPFGYSAIEHLAVIFSTEDHMILATVDSAVVGVIWLARLSELHISILLDICHYSTIEQMCFSRNQGR